jgi:outer membrane protein TolC
MAHSHIRFPFPGRGATWSSRTAAALLLLLLMPALAAAQSDALSLDAAIRLALQNNERALAADQRVAAADSRLTKARAFFLPTLSLNGSYTRRPFEVTRAIGNQQVIVQAYNALAWSANFSMILFDSHSVPTLLGAGADLATEQLNTVDAKRKLAFEVSNAFLTTLSVDQVLQASQRRLDFAKQSLDAAKARYAGGLVSVNDVTRAELEYATAETGVVQGQGQVETIYLQLGFLLNAPTPTKLSVPDFLLTAVEEKRAVQEALITEAQARRPDVQALRFRAKSMHAATIESTLKWFPTLSLTGRYSYTNEAGLTGKNFNWNAGLSMSWTIFDGFNRNGEYSERLAVAYQADLDLQAGLRKVEVDVRTALVSLGNQRAVLKQSTVAYEVAVRNAAETSELYRQGLSSALQVADANVRLFEASVALVQARYGLGIAYLNLEAALGLDPLGKEPNVEN